VLIVLVGLSRIYLGVHYLGDVLLGWGIGFLTLAILYFVEKPLSNVLSRYRPEIPYIIVFILGFTAIVVTSYFLQLPPGDNFGALGGMLMGLAIALPLEQRFVGFTVEPYNGQKWRIIIRIALGLILVLAIMLGLSDLLPTTEVWLRALRYMLVVFTGVFIWPFIFSKLKL
jgi:MFS superfamily sulfate permease-like transporter